MRAWPLIAALAVALTLGAPARAEEEVCALAPPLTLRLPAGLKAQEATYRTEVEQAVRKVVSRFADWGYPVCAEDLIDQVVVFDDMALARQALAARFDVALDQVPAPIGGTVDQKTMFVVSRPLFAASWPTIHPDSPWTDAHYGALLVHELAHRAHALAATKIAGSEAGMGPTWFFEGLAVHCAGQYTPVSPLTRAEFETLAAGPKPLPYPQYGRMVAALAAKVPMKTLLREAAKPDFAKNAGAYLK